MTADRSLNKTRRIPFFWRQFFSQKTVLILSALIFFLSMSVPALSAVSERWAGSDVTELEKTYSLFESVLGIVSVSTFFLMALAALSAALVFGVYSDRKSAYYYLALPVSRDRLFCQRTLAGFLAPLPGYLVNFLLVLAMLLTSPVGVGPILPMLFAYTGYALLFCFATYPVCVFAASLTSNKIGTLLLSGYLFLLVPVHLGLAKLLTGNVLANLQRHIVKARIENLYLFDERTHVGNQPPLNALQALNRNGTVRKAQQQVGITVNNRA